MAKTQHTIDTGIRLRVAIESTGKSKAAWARKYGVSESNVGNWMRGDSYPNLEALIAFCDDEGLTLDWFFRGILVGVVDAWAERLRRPKQASLVE